MQTKSNSVFAEFCQTKIGFSSYKNFFLKTIDSLKTDIKSSLNLES